MVQIIRKWEKNNCFIHIEGYDYGASNYFMKVIKENQDMICFRIKGMTHRDSLANFSYHNPSYSFIRKESNGELTLLNREDIEYSRETAKEALGKALFKVDNFGLNERKVKNYG